MDGSFEVLKICNIGPGAIAQPLKSLPFLFVCFAFYHNLSIQFAEISTFFYLVISIGVDCIMTWTCGRRSSITLSHIFLCPLVTTSFGFIYVRVFICRLYFTYGLLRRDFVSTLLSFILSLAQSSAQVLGGGCPLQTLV